MKENQSLNQLRKEKQKLKLRMEVSKQEFAQSLNNTQSETKHFLLKKVIIPAGIVGITGIGITKIRKSNKKKKQKKATSLNYTTRNFTNQEKTEKSAFMNWQGLIMKLLPIGIQLVQSYFMKNDDQDEEVFN